MNSFKIKDFGVVILSILLMATLLSCTKTTQNELYSKEIDNLQLEEIFSTMLAQTELLANQIQLEQDYFKSDEVTQDYDSFANSLSPSFEQIETEFALAHKEVLQSIESLREDFLDKNELDQIQKIDNYQMKLSLFFQDLLSYHYMILETDLILGLFNESVLNLMTYMTDGNITSIEYNSSLESIMEKYNGLLDANASIANNQELLNDEEATIDILDMLDQAKEDIQDTEVLSEVDQKVNEQVFNLFDYIEQSVLLIKDYAQTIHKEEYSSNNQSQIDNGANQYFQDIIEDIENPFQD